jgi:hypothetical protein
MSKIVYDFPSFLTRLYEYNEGSANSMIIGDSLVPSIYQNISADTKKSFLRETPDTGLNHSGWAVLQLNRALAAAPVRNEIRNVFISIGSNEVYTEIPASPLKKLAQNLKEKFPNAKYYTFRGVKGYETLVDGGSDWFNKKIPNIDSAIESYYAKFPPLGINVLDTPSIYTTKHPGPSTPGIISVAKEISKIAQGGAPSLIGSSGGNRTTSGSDNIIVGDSQTPFIAKRAKNIRMLDKKGSKQALWLGGMGLDWLKNAVASYPSSPGVANVVINIGTNGGFSQKDDVAGLFKELRRAFPKAKFFAVQGSWGWGGNKNITTDKVNKYYSLFSKEGASIINPPIGSVSDPHGDLPIYSQIGKAIDSLITNTPVASAEPASLASTGLSDSRPDSTEQFQDWLDANKPGWAWGYPGGVVNKAGGYGKFGPRTSKAWDTYKDLYLKNPKGSKAAVTPIVPKVDPSSNVVEKDGKITTSNCTIWTPKNVKGPVDVFVLYPGIKVGDNFGKEYMPPLVKNAVGDWFNKYVIVIPNKHTTPFANVKADLDAVLSNNKLSQKSLSVGIFSGSGNDSSDITKYLGDLSLKNLILMDPTPGNNLTSAAKKLSSKGTGIYLMYNPKNWGDAGYYGGISGGSLYGPISKLATAVPNSDRVTTAHMSIPTEMLKKYKTQIERNLL